MSVIHYDPYELGNVAAAVAGRVRKGREMRWTAKKTSQKTCRSLSATR